MAGIIKANGTQRAQSTVHPSEYRFSDIAQRTEQQLDKARERATRIIEEAKLEAGQLSAQAQRSARDAAIRSVESTMRHELNENLKTVLPALQQTADQIQLARQQWVVHWEEHLVSFAIGIA